MNPISFMNPINTFDGESPGKRMIVLVSVGFERLSWKKSYTLFTHYPLQNRCGRLSKKALHKILKIEKAISHYKIVYYKKDNLPTSNYLKQFKRICNELGAILNQFLR